MLSFSAAFIVADIPLTFFFLQFIIRPAQRQRAHALARLRSSFSPAQATSKGKCVSKPSPLVEESIMVNDHHTQHLIWIQCVFPFLFSLFLACALSSCLGTRVGGTAARDASINTIRSRPCSLTFPFPLSWTTSHCRSCYLTYTALGPNFQL